MLLANAALSFAYTKDEIVAVAGVFYAAAAYAAARHLIHRIETRTVWHVTAGALLLLVLSSAWAVRSAGVHHVMRRQAFRVQGDWAEVPARMRREGSWPDDVKARGLIERLRADAIETPLPNRARLRWSYVRWFGD